ncbi:MAG: hypothetical protein U1F43_23745 [Myxococcota bacterium]
MTSSMRRLPTLSNPPTPPRGTAGPTAPDPRASERGKAIVWILVLLLVAGAAFAVYWFAFRGGPGGGASTKLASTVVPAGADTVAGIDAGALLSSPELADLLKKQGVDVEAVKAKLAESGVKPEDLRSVVVAADVPDAGAPEVFLAVQTTADAKAVKGALGALKAMIPGDAGDKIDLSNVQAFDGGLVLAGSGPFFDQAAALAKGQGKGGMSAELAQVRDALDTSAPIWFATTLPKDMSKGMGGMGKQIFGNGTPTHAGVSIRVGSKIDIKAALRIDGADAAKVADDLGGFLSMAGMVAKGPQAELLKGLELGSSGAVLTLTMSLTAEQAKSLSESRLPF